MHLCDDVKTVIRHAARWRGVLGGNAASGRYPSEAHAGGTPAHAKAEEEA